ncbi:MAG: hypothetical protein EBR15_02500 [Gammaproteobacteria bacterium]|nr:hypothetical protein [Gammaproteobacteria bacterium]
MPLELHLLVRTQDLECRMEAVDRRVRQYHVQRQQAHAARTDDHRWRERRGLHDRRHRVGDFDAVRLQHAPDVIERES